MERFREKWDWPALVNNPAVPWDWDYLLMVFKRLGNPLPFHFSQAEWDRFFTPYLDDETVFSILAEITPSLPQTENGQT